MNKPITGLLVLALASMFVLAACSNDSSTGNVVRDTGNAASDNPTTTKNAGTTAPIRLGVTLPMTGEAASLGDNIMAGAELAVQEVNAKGGINGRMLELVVEDDKCARDGITSMTKLTSVDNVDAIIGPLCSAAGGPGLPVVEASGTPAIIYASAPHLTMNNEFIFRIYPSDAFAGKFMAHYSQDKLRAKKAAVVYSQNDWGKGISDTFAAEFAAIGGDVVLNEGVAQDGKDFRTTITKLKAENPDVIIAPLYPANAIAFLKQAKEAGITAQIILGDIGDSEEVLSTGYADGALIVLAHLNAPEDLAARAAKATGRSTGIWTNLGYDAVNIYADVMTRVGTDKEAVRDALATGTFTGVSSPSISFDQNGDLNTAAYDVKIVRDAKSEVLA